MISMLAMGRPNKRLERHGFTLFEVLITAVLVSMGFALLLRAFSMAISADKYVEYRAVALNLAKEKMEKVKNTGFDWILTETDYPGSGEPYLRFVDSRVTSVALYDGDDDDNPDADLKRVTVDVYWTQKGAQQKVELETLVCDY